MSFFSRVLGGIFGSSNNNNNNNNNNGNNHNNNNNNREEQTQPQSEVNNAASIKQHEPSKGAHEAAENSNDDPPIKPKPIIPPSPNKLKDESKKPRKKKSKDSKDIPLPLPSPSTTPSAPPPPPSSLPSPAITVTVTPTATTPTQPPESKLPQPSSSLDGSGKKRFANIFKRTSKNNPETAGGAEMKIGVAPIQPHLPKDAKPKNKKPKKSKKATSTPNSRRLRSGDDVFPAEFRDTKKHQHQRSKNHKHIKASKSAPAQSSSMTPETTLTESPSAKEGPMQQKKKKKKTKKSTRSRMSLSKTKDAKDKTIKELKEQPSVETDVTVEQPNAEMASSVATPDSSAVSTNEKKDEIKGEASDSSHWNKDDQDSLRGAILDKEEVNRLITDLKQEDREPLPNIIHDPWLPLTELMARTNDLYSDKRARNNAAITYEKFVEYELCSSKENKGGSGEARKPVSINPKIDREHFDVQTRASIGNDTTEVIDHKAGTNHPDKN